MYFLTVTVLLIFWNVGTYVLVALMFIRTITTITIISIIIIILS